MYILSLKPSFSLCWRSMFSGPEKAAGWSTSRSLLPCAGQMLSKYRVCLKAGATVCLCLLLCFSARRANKTPLTHLYGILTMLLFFKQRCLQPSLKHFSLFLLLIILFPPPLLLSLSAVHSSLFLGLVVRWPSTHEQLELNLWPWRDLSPLLPNHAHRWRCVFLIFSEMSVESVSVVVVVVCVCVLLCA